MDTTKSKWWVRWYTEGMDSRPVAAPTPIEWWCTGYSDTHSINCAIVHGEDEADCIRVLQVHGWPECEELDSCEEVDMDWRPNSGRFPPSSPDEG